MRTRATVFLSLLFFLLGVCDSAAVGRNEATPASCAVTPAVEAEAPREPRVGPLSGAWHINADRSIWALQQVWRAGIANKEAWIRPAGVQLVVTGHQLNGSGPPHKVRIPGNYRTRFQASGMEFPKQGCWEVKARAGDRELRFVIEVEPSH
jgi:hypothetical protein